MPRIFILQPSAVILSTFLTWNLETMQVCCPTYMISTEFIRILLPVASAQQAMSSTWFHALWLLCAGKIPLEHRANHISMKVEYQIQRSIPRHNAARALFKKSLSRFLTLCKFRRLSLKPQEHSLQRVSHAPSERSMLSCWYQRHSSHQNPELGTAELEDKHLIETCTSLQHAKPRHSWCVGRNCIKSPGDGTVRSIHNCI